MKFIFENENKVWAGNQAEIPIGIKSKKTLFDTLSVALRFPSYFGGNWDALEECIRDLSWLPRGDVILRHRDLPQFEDSSSILTYLKILTDAVERWEVTDERKLIVVFPANVKDVIRSILGSS